MSTPKPLTFAWYELMTPDVPAALDFYRSVFGWTTRDSGLPGGVYTQIEVQGQAIGGAMALTDEMRAAGARPGWLGYVAVNDLVATTSALVAAGGKVIRPMVEIPGMIQFTIVADPHGAVFAMFRGLTPGHTLPTFPPGTPGAIGWRELHAGDGPAAWEFYSRLFGWTQAEAMDMGPLGVYRIWAAGGPPIGGMMTKMPQTPAPYWQFYVGVAGVEAAIARSTSRGATVIHGPSEVPGGSWIANLVDPQGAVFAMVSAQR